MLLRLTLAAVALLALAGTSTANQFDLDDLERSPAKFSYYQLGKHVPERSGWKNYLEGRFVIHPDLALPIEMDHANGEHMFCNSQVYGLNKDGKPTGDRKTNHIANFAFPWTSTFCERRDFDGTFDQETARCGGLKSHQGSDCRPPKPLADTYFMIAVEGGRIVLAKRNEIRLQGDSGILWKYRHGGTPLADIVPGQTGVRVEKGRRLAKITDLGSTSIHLHIESERPAASDRDNLPSLVLAYQRTVLGLSKDAEHADKRTTPILSNGEIAMDPRFEIMAEQTTAPCAASELSDPIVTEHVAKFESLWCHEGSIVGLVNQAGQLSFVQYKPSPDRRAEAERRPMLFLGAGPLSNVSGNATHYSVRCGDGTFPVSGREATQGGIRRIELTGARPTFDGACDRPSFVDATLQFSFVRAFQAPVEPGAPVSEPVFGVTVEGPCAAVTAGDPIQDHQRFKFASLWCHNGSLVGLAMQGDKRQLVYFKPKESLRESANRKPVLYNGELRDGRYGGSAVHFQASCNDPAYQVAGVESRIGGKRAIVLSGERRRQRENCSVIDTLRQELSLEYVARLTDDDAGDQPIADTSCTSALSQPPLTFTSEHTFSSLWCFGGSVLGMSEDSGQLRILYYRPRAELRSKVAADPLFFSGNASQSTYTGELRWTEEVCGERRSQGNGSIALSEGRPAIRLATRRPNPALGCDQPTYIEQVVELKFLETVSIAVRPTTPEPGPSPDPSGGGATGGGSIACTDPSILPTASLLTEQRIKRFSPRARADMIAALLCHPRFLVNADLTTELRVIHFMTQVAAETSGMFIIEENMNYSAERLREIFPTRVTPEQARQLAHRPREIANHVYGGRLGNLGQHTDDGWTYRGSGYLQLTGRENFRKRGNEVRLPLEENPELARQATEGLLAATAYWNARKCNIPADTDDVKATRFCVNGGTNGLAHARLWLTKAQRAFGSQLAESADDAFATADVAEALTDNGLLERFAETSATENQVADALRRLQRENGLPETGELDDPTFYALVDPQRWRNPLTSE